MQIEIQSGAVSYDDLKRLANKHNVDAVFWWAASRLVPGATAVDIQAYLNGGTVVVECGVAEKPKSFHSDFPHAIENTGSAAFATSG